MRHMPYFLDTVLRANENWRRKQSRRKHLWKVRALINMRTAGTEEGAGEDEKKATRTREDAPASETIRK